MSVRRPPAFPNKRPKKAPKDWTMESRGIFFRKFSECHGKMKRTGIVIFTFSYEALLHMIFFLAAFRRVAPLASAVVNTAPPARKFFRASA